MLVSIIMLTYNQWAYTDSCLKSVADHTPEEHELIIVDNASTDGTVEHVRDYARGRGNVRFIENRLNRGFAAGNNQGLAVANGDYLLLLNNDTVVTRGWLGRMLALFSRYPQIGLVGPMTNFAPGPQQIEVPYPGLAELPAFAEHWAADHAGQDLSFMRLVGFCLLFRRSVLDLVGGLDERFLTGSYEDDDFCIRAHFMGFDARIVRDTFIHHAGSQSFKGAGIDVNDRMRQNWEVFKKKWRMPISRRIEDGYLKPDLNWNTPPLYEPFAPPPPRNGIALGT